MGRMRKNLSHTPHFCMNSVENAANIDKKGRMQNIFIPTPRKSKKAGRRESIFSHTPRGLIGYHIFAK